MRLRIDAYRCASVRTDAHPPAPQRTGWHRDGQRRGRGNRAVGKLTVVDHPINPATGAIRTKDRDQQ
jgi:hypothetical protein